MPHRISLNFLIGMLGIVIMITAASITPATAADKKKAIHLVEVTQAEATKSNTANNWYGSLYFNELVNIYNQEKGRIDSFPFKEGDYVKKNQVLVHLDDRLLRAEKTRLLAQISQAKTDLNRIQVLVKKQALGTNELDQAKTQLAIYNAEKNLLDIRLSYFTINAPFSGIVTDRFANEGDAVSAQQHLLTLSNNNSLVAKVQISETALPSLKMDAPATVIIPSSGEKYAGKISRIYPKLHPSTRQATVEITFDSIPKNLYSGQSVLAEIKGATKDRILIPLAALKRDGDGEYVFLLKEDGKAHRQAVTSSAYISGKVEITSGIKLNDKVITRGFLGLQNGKVVKVSGELDTSEDTAKKSEIPNNKSATKPDNANTFSGRLSKTWNSTLNKIKDMVN
jgi:RND family efflux transporter MFP subunit